MQSISYQVVQRKHIQTFETDTNTRRKLNVAGYFQDFPSHAEEAKKIDTYDQLAVRKD